MTAATSTPAIPESGGQTDTSAGVQSITRSILEMAGGGFKDDHGMYTSVVVKSGVTLKTSEAIRPTVLLRPYRTFQEVEQPESEFLVRISERGVRFIEADGGMWKLRARETVKSYLEAALAEEMQAGLVYVAL